MKTNLLLSSLTLASTLSLAACHSQSGGTGQPSPSPIIHPASEEGGVNGGGGGTLPANPISHYDVQELVRKAKKTLNPFIKNELKFYDPLKSGPIDKKLYGGPVTLWDVLQDTDIEIERYKPCLDANGEAVDGSVHASRPNAICISSYRIAPKLIKERASTEIYALILHELSHKLGTTEDEAKEFQKTAAFYLSEFVAKVGPEAFAIKAESAAGTASQKLHRLTDGFSHSDDEALEKLFVESLTAFTEFNRASTEVPLSIFNHYESDYFDLQMDQLVIANWHILATTGNSKERAYWQEQLDNVFLDSNTVTEHDYKVRHFGSSFPSSVYNDQPLRKMNSREEVLTFLKEFEKSFAFTSQAVRNLWLNSQMGPMPVVESKVNPWVAFIGDYEVQDQHCSDSNNALKTVGYRIYQPKDSTAPRFVRLWQNGSSDDGELANGEMFGDGRSAVQVQGSDGHAIRIAETGDRWGNQYENYTMNMEKQSETSYVLTTTFLSRRFGNPDYNSTCKSTLRRK